MEIGDIKGQTSKEEKTILMKKMSIKEGTLREQLPSMEYFQWMMCPPNYSSKKIL